ncbi:MAG: hypothetical protein EOO29_50060, partial [Comamonadaceae bacterium]
PSSGGWLAGVLLLALLATGGAAVVRRRGWKLHASAVDPGGSIKRLASQALTPQASVHAIRWSGEELLLACTAHQVSVIARRPLRASEGDAA